MPRWVVVLCFAALGSNVLQAATGSIRGRVEDPAGSLIASASVVLENEQTGFLHSSLTDSQGEFIFPGLAPGSYQLRATAAGYSDTLMPVHVDIDQTEVIELSMRIAPRQETVVASARLWNEPASWGAVITGNDISSLPLNEHNFMTFALLAPGAQMEASGSQLSSQGGGVSVSGGREQSNSFLLDGNDNNDPFVRQYSALAPMDAVQEFKVQGSGSDVQFGGNSGGQINVVLRSGENAFHGSASEYLRNRHLDARNYFDLPPCAGLSAGITCGNIPRLDRSQFGGTLGGPIHRGQTLFFLAYEGVSLRQAATRTATVPSQDQRAVALAAVPDWIRNPAGVAVFDRLPAANVGFDLATSNLFVSTPVIRNTGNHLSLKIDHRIGDRDQFAFHYVFADDDRSYPFDPLLPSTNLPGYGSSAWDRGQNAGLTWSHPLHPRAINELRVGFNRHIGQWMQEHAGQDVSAELGFPDVITRPADLGVPLITIAGFDGIGEPRNLPQDRHDTTLIASENLVWTPRFGSGHHEIRIGGDVSHFQYVGYLDVLARGQWFFMGAFTGNALQDLLLGLPTYALGVSGDTDAILTTSGSAVYVQDHWGINEKLALTVGARWEFATPPAEAHDRISVPDLSPESLTCSPQPDCQFIRAGTAGMPRAIYRSDFHDLDPRVGISFRPLRKSDLAVRASYGIYSATGLMNPTFFPRVNPPFFSTRVFYNFGTSNIQSILSQPAVPQPTIAVMIAPDFRDSYMQQWRAELEKSSARKTMSIAYVGSKGTGLLMQRNLNQAIPGGLPPYPQFGPIELIGTNASSIYHAVQTQTGLETKRLSMYAAYTFSRSIDNASAFFGADGEPGIPQNSFDLNAERGLSDFHAKHRLVVTAVHHIPAVGQDWRRGITKGWTVGGILALQSGRPFTVNRGIDQSHDGTATLGYFADRPDQVSNPFHAGPVPQNPDPRCQLTLSEGGRAADQVRTANAWFNPCAFVDPGVAFGNTGRNSLIGPDLRAIDFSVARSFRFNEASRIECRIEAFNALNRPNFDLPDRTFDSGTFSRLSSANRNGLETPRQVQVAVRYSF